MKKELQALRKVNSKSDLQKLIADEHSERVIVICAISVVIMLIIAFFIFRG